MTVGRVLTCLEVVVCLVAIPVTTIGAAVGATPWLVPGFFVVYLLGAVPLRRWLR